MTTDIRVGPDSAADLYAIQHLASQLDHAQVEIVQLKSALRNGRTIGTAIGILAERYDVPPAEAFRLLSRASQYTNRKVRDLAAELVCSGKPLDVIIGV